MRRSLSEMALFRFILMSPLQADSHGWHSAWSMGHSVLIKMKGIQYGIKKSPQALLQAWGDKCTSKKVKSDSATECFQIFENRVKPQHRLLIYIFPDRPSSQGSSKSSKRECSAVALKPQAFNSSDGFIALPQHSGISDSSALVSTVFPQLTHS
jgi:hypothetical protein